MKRIVLILFFVQFTYGQDDFLAKQYFNDGEYEKAVVFYENLVRQNPRRSDYFEGMVACYQQLEQYQKAEAFLLEKINYGNPYPTIYIELGYNYRLQDQPEMADKYYQMALETIEENPNFGYGVGFRFQRYALLDYALKAYNRAMALNPELDYNFQIARIYGEQGNVEKMFDSYLELILSGKTSKANVLRNIDSFINADPQNENNILLKKILLQKAQRNPDLLWNELLSWLFVQQRQYYNAFVQEKAIYRRADGSSFQRMEGLGGVALENDAYDDARTIFEYIEKNSQEPVVALNAQLHLIDIDLIAQTSKKDLSQIQQRFESLLVSYGYQSETLQLQIAYANFLTFKMDNPGEAEKILQKTLDLSLARFPEAYVKLALGDILVFNQKFNQALILFTQVQKNLKNDVLGQDARFKVAQTSFYKGDFDWALTQLKVLRSSTSQLIANDAMQLSLLISDNSFEDSTQTALKKFARADLLAYQNKTDDAITLFNDILENHKGEKIEDDTLLKQGQLFEEQENFSAAEFNYIKIVEFYGNGILADDAHFALAELYRSVLDNPQKAMVHYERIIYNYQDSYFFPQARKYFRLLRGDSIN
ncbi:MAG: tetratricopeptide repeat protein [Flavobacteriaceae bacterium]